MSILDCLARLRRLAVVTCYVTQLFSDVLELDVESVTVYTLLRESPLPSVKNSDGRTCSRELRTFMANDFAVLSPARGHSSLELNVLEQSRPGICLSLQFRESSPIELFSWNSRSSSMEVLTDVKTSFSF